MKPIKKVIRLPRPMGITQSLAEYHHSKDEALLSKIKKYMIQQWLISNGVVCGRSYNVMELSNFLKCNPDDIRLQMRDNMLSSKIWDKESQQAIIDSLMGQQITWALEDRMEIENQVRILKDSQGHSYMPFITSELNKAIGMKLSSSASLQSIVRTLTGGGSVNIFNQFNQQNNQVGVTIEDAVATVQEEVSKAIAGKEVQYIEAHYDVADFPEVVASKQAGIDTSKEILTMSKGELDAIVDNYKGTLESFDKDHHEIRREIELGVDMDAKDPELSIY